MTTNKEVTYNEDGELVTLHNVRYAQPDEDGVFLVVMHTPRAPPDAGWYEAQEIRDYEERKTKIPLGRVVRVDEVPR